MSSGVWVEAVPLREEEYLAARDATPAYLHLAATVIIRAMKDTQDPGSGTGRRGAGVINNDWG